MNTQFRILLSSLIGFLTGAGLMLVVLVLLGKEAFQHEWHSIAAIDWPLYCWLVLPFLLGLGSLTIQIRIWQGWKQALPSFIACTLWGYFLLLFGWMIHPLAVNTGTTNPNVIRSTLLSYALCGAVAKGAARLLIPCPKKQKDREPLFDIQTMFKS